MNDRAPEEVAPFEARVGVILHVEGRAVEDRGPSPPDQQMPRTIARNDKGMITINAGAEPVAFRSDEE